MDYKKELHDLMDTVFKEGASDLHLAEGRQPTIRVAGFLLPLVKKSVLNREMILGFIDAILTKEKKEEFFHKKEIDFSFDYAAVGRFQINGFFQQGRIGFALR